MRISLVSKLEGLLFIELSIKKNGFVPYNNSDLIAKLGGFPEYMSGKRVAVNFSSNISMF